MDVFDSAYVFVPFWLASDEGVFTPKSIRHVFVFTGTLILTISVEYVRMRSLNYGTKPTRKHDRILL